MSLPNKKLNLLLLAAQCGDGVQIRGGDHRRGIETVSTKTAESHKPRKCNWAAFPILLLSNSQACISFY